MEVYVHFKMENKKHKKEDSFWEEGSFTQTMSSYEMKDKMRTFHMKHDEEMNFNCKECNVKISAHNKDWHDEMCDGCFHKKYFSDASVKKK